MSKVELGHHLQELASSLKQKYEKKRSTENYLAALLSSNANTFNVNTCSIVKYLDTELLHMNNPDHERLVKTMKTALTKNCDSVNPETSNDNLKYCLSLAQSDSLRNYILVLKELLVKKISKNGS